MTDEELFELAERLLAFQGRLSSMELRVYALFTMTPERSSFPGIGLKLPGSESDSTSSEKFKYAWSLTSTLPYAFISHRRICLHIRTG
jgi:hypothetical protein